MASRPNVVIIGGGIGGLFAANALIRQGLTISIYEQASALGEIGAGVYVTPNAVRHLEQVGLGPPSRSRARGRSGLYFARRYAGADAVSDASGWNATFGMHRADFVNFLTANPPAGSSIPATVLSASAERRRGPYQFANGATAGGCGCRRRNTLAPLYVVPPSKPVFAAPFLIEVWSRASACKLADGPLANVASLRHSGLPCCHGTIQLRRFRADRRK
jgi:salicylate hydroxylase